ncbi:MAG: zeta toxin family protein [Oscillospiraceae bacterium]|nr:zeta toxin family protein [Oscillospiraceae bacterium]
MGESLEKIIKRYKLSEQKHIKIGEEIKKLMLYDRFPVEKPKAIIDIAPPASGKTGLNAFGQEQFLNNNVVIINSDDIKPFHPKVDEIAKLYPQYYTKITDEESNTWTSSLFETAMREGYNIIFEGTGRTARILETIKSKMQGYEVIIRGMAVNELNCLMSLIERYECQVTTRGWGRLVTQEHFYETYNEMPNTIDVIERSGIVSAVEVYKRGRVPSQPVKIYDSRDIGTGRFQNAKYATLGGRIEDEKNANGYFEDQINKILWLVREKQLIEEEEGILSKINELHDNFKKKLICKDGERVI